MGARSAALRSIRIGPDLNIEWYPLSRIENPDSGLYRLTRNTFSFGPCLAFMLGTMLLFDIVPEWGRLSMRQKALRSLAVMSFLSVFILTYANFKEMAAWILD
jgi:hypothetical protein